MNTRTRTQLLAVVVAASALLAAGCNEQRTDTAGQKLDRTVEKVAAATDNAANRTANAVDDTTITTKVKAAVLAEEGLKTMEIRVATKDGVVTLEGTVGSAELKQRATNLAQRVEGVHSVSDQLVVKPS